MDRQAKIDLLNRALHGTVNSVLYYIETAHPHVPEGCEGHMEKVFGLRAEQAELAGEITSLVTELDGVPAVGAFPYWNVDLNFLDLRFLARFAMADEEKTVAALEPELEKTRSDPRVYGLLSRVLAAKRTAVSVLSEVSDA
jgi:hypothetical protein